VGCAPLGLRRNADHRSIKNSVQERQFKLTKNKYPCTDNVHYGFFSKMSVLCNVGVSVWMARALILNT